MHPGERASGCRAENGFTYVVMLCALAIFGAGLAVLGQTWRQVAARDKEDELLQVGAAYVRAIGQYYQHSPGIAKTYPIHLADLLEDKRFVGTERHLRQLYRDPVSGDADWGLVRAPGGGIIGVYSVSEKPTLRRRAVLVAADTVVIGQRYSEWKFIYNQRSAQSSAAADASGGSHAP